MASWRAQKRHLTWGVERTRPFGHQICKSGARTMFAASTSSAKIRVALLDWDRTLSEGFMLERWAAFLEAKGYFKSDDAQMIADLIGGLQDDRASYASMAERVPTHYANGLRGQVAARIALEAEAFGRLEQRRMFQFAKSLLEQLAARQIHPVIISGAPAEVLLAMRQSLGLGDIYGLEVAHSHGRYSSRLSANPATARVKQWLVDAAISRRSDIVLAAGDSEADLPLLVAARVRIVVDNAALLKSDSETLHISSDTSDPADYERIGALLTRVTQ